MSTFSANSNFWVNYSFNLWKDKEKWVWSTAHWLAHIGNTFPCSCGPASCCYNRWVWSNSEETEPHQNTAAMLTCIYKWHWNPSIMQIKLHSPSLSRAGPPKAKPAPTPPGLPSTDVCFFLLAVKWEGDWRDLLFVPCSIIRCEHLEQNDYWYQLLHAYDSNKAYCFHNTQHLQSISINETLPMWTYRYQRFKSS